MKHILLLEFGKVDKSLRILHEKKELNFELMSEKGLNRARGSLCSC